MPQLPESEAKASVAHGASWEWLSASLSYGGRRAPLGGPGTQLSRAASLLLQTYREAMEHVALLARIGADALDPTERHFLAQLQRIERRRGAAAQSGLQQIWGIRVGALKPSALHPGGHPPQERKRAS